VGGKEKEKDGQRGKDEVDFNVLKRNMKMIEVFFITSDGKGQKAALQCINATKSTDFNSKFVRGGCVCELVGTRAAEID